MCRKEPGVTLIECVVALFLLAVILGAVATLFVQGGRTVADSRRLTQATRLASGILESTRSWPASDLYVSFGKTVDDSSFEVTSLSNPRAQAWQPEIESRLPGGSARIRVDPVGGATFGTARGIRVRVSIEWKYGPGLEGTRAATLAAVRF